MSERTIGQKVGQWLINISAFITILTTLGLGTLFSTSEKARESVNQMFHVEPITPEIEEPAPKKSVKTIETVRIIKEKHDHTEIIRRLDEHDAKLKVLKDWHE
jgi:hypothetical protein